MQLSLNTKLGELQRIKFRIEGVQPLLFCRGGLIDTFDPWTRKLKALTAKKEKPPEVQQEIRDVQWRGSLYWSDQWGLYLPAENFFAGIRDAAKKDKKGTIIKQSLLVYAEGSDGDIECVKIHYEGPQTLEEMAENPEYRDSRPAQVNGKGVVVTRGRVPAGWWAIFIAQFDAKAIDPEKIVAFLQLAGFAGGMGDYRPRFGRFVVTSAKSV